MKITKIECETKDDIESLRECDALTWEGLNISDENLSQVAEWVNTTAKFKDNPKFYITSGKLMNESYGLRGDNAYSDDLNIVSIKPEDVQNFYNFIVSTRFNTGGRWMSDIIDNNIRHQS